MRTTNVSTRTNLRTKLIVGGVLMLVGLFGIDLSAGYLNWFQPNSASLQSVSTPVQLAGIIRVVAMDGLGSSTPDQVYLETGDQDYLLTIPSTIVTPDSGTSASVTGHLLDDGTISVSKIDVPVEVAGEKSSKSTVSAASISSGDYHVLVVMGYYPGQSAPTTPTQADAQAVMFGPSPSVADFYHDNSFGHVTVSGTVMGWIPLSGPESSNIVTSAGMALQAAKTANPSLDLHQFQHVVLISPYTATNLPDGYALVGQAYVSSPDGALTLGVEMIRSTIVNLPRSTPLLPYTVIHEFGHGLGLGHAGLLGCNDVPIATNCRISEYGDRFDIMGGAYELQYAEDLNGPHLDTLGWLSTTNIQTVDPHTGGTYTLEPIENRDTGLKVIKIPRSSSDFGNVMYLEYRRPIGYDTALDDPTVFTGALVHIMNRGEFSNSGTVWSDSLLIDPTPPALYKQNSLTVGSSITDPVTGVVVSATGIDANGITIHVSTSTVPVYADLMLKSPVQNGTYSGSTIPFRSSALSLNGIARVEYYLAGASTPFATSTDSNWYPASLDVSGYANNTTLSAYMLSVDSIGTRTSTAPISFRVNSPDAPSDVTPPTVSITSPTEGSIVSSPVTLHATIDDDHGVSTSRFYVDCPESWPANWCSYTYLGYPYELARVLSAGTHTLRVSADDYSYHTTTSPIIHFSVDNASPTVTLISPAANTTVSKVVPLTFSATDDLGLDHVSVYVDSGLVGTITAAPFTVNWDSSQVADGSHNWYAVAVDRAGHSTSTVWQYVTVQNGTITKVTIPAPTVTLLGLGSGNTATGQNVIVRINGDPQYIVSAQLRVDGVRITSKTTAPFSFYIDSPAYPNGKHTVAVVIKQMNNVTTIKSVSVVTKNNMVVSVISPGNNTTVRKNISITPRVRGGYGPARIEYIIDGKKRLALKTKSPFSYVWNSGSTKTGWHTITVRVTDKKGKVSSSTTRVKVSR